VQLEPRIEEETKLGPRHSAGIKPLRNVSASSLFYCQLLLRSSERTRRNRPMKIRMKPISAIIEDGSGTGKHFTAKING
jgi:hypothetical protein